MAPLAPIDRSEAARLGLDTVRILERGTYDVGGRTVRVEVEPSVRGTVSHPPHEPLPAPQTALHATRFEVTGESTLAAGRRLHGEGHRVTALNFASAKNPGGGFLSGARAQEESLARSSGLHACLVDQPMYAHHRPLTGGLYTHWVLYSPDVPVFRDDDGTLLPEPWPCSFLTCPAVNAGAARRKERVLPIMRERVQRLLTVAAHHAAGTLVLGAWGCGVFKNDPDHVAGLFHEALTGALRGVFERVVFAVLDPSPQRRTLTAFERLAWPG